MDKTRMVEVTKHGFMRYKRINFICPVCGCEFNTNSNYVKGVKYAVIDWRVKSTFRTTCPECGYDYCECELIRDNSLEDEDEA